MIADADLSVLEMDAASRLAICVINHANSPLIAQCGDLSHDKIRGGFISRDGRVHVSKDASYIERLPYPGQAMGPYLPSVPTTTGYIPMISQGEQPLSGMSLSPAVIDPTIPAPSTSTVSVDSKMIPLFRALLPYDIPNLLSYLTEQYDVIYLCRSLGLDGINYDTISKGIFIRSFADNMVNPPVGGSILPIFDALGSFVRANVYYQWTTYELKVFKYTTRPGLYPFLFRPEHSGIWFNTENGRAPLGGPVVLDTIDNLLNRTCPANANAGLIDAGDLKYLDWEILRWHPVIFVWHSEESLLSRNHFAAALHFVSEAMKHGLAVSVFDNATNTLMGLQNIIQQACRFNLKIPQNMNTESTFNKEFYNNEYFNR